ncbi:MAG TPA: restriction endonuclease subunit S [Bacteroidales bacterium]|jgi:type I restriction enzyme S subunit
MSTTTPHTQIAYKDTPIGKIPADWEVKRLGDFLEFKNGINSSKENYGNGMPFINVMEVISKNYITYEDIPGAIEISEEQAEIYLVTKGDVLFNRTSETQEEVGLAAVYESDEKVVFGGFVIRGKEKESLIDNLFKRYCYRSSILRRQIIRNGQGAVRANIGQGELSKINIPLPPLSEQKRIAEVLSTWDQAIQLTEQLIRQKEQRKKWLMQNLLTGKMRLKGFSGESQFRVLGKFITEVSDRNKNGEIKNVLSVTNSKGFINQAEQFEREVASADVSNYKIVRKGQFAYNPSRVNVGSLDLLRKFDIGILSPMYVVFETDQKNLIPEYLFYLLKTNWFYGHIPMFVQGSVRDSLSFDGLCGMKFFIPSIEEQTAIAEVLQTAEKEIELRKAKTEKLKEQKKGLMQQLLTGRKRLKIEIKV